MTFIKARHAAFGFLSLWLTGAAWECFCGVHHFSGNVFETRFKAAARDRS